MLRLRSRQVAGPLALVATVAAIAVLGVRPDRDAAAPTPTAAIATAATPQAPVSQVAGVSAQSVPRSLAPRGPWRPTTGPPIDPAQADLAFGERSHWLQPWRSYLDTWPATRLRDAIGINFNVLRGADAAARRLAAAGVRRARVELPWAMMRFDRPGDVADQHLASMRARLGALRRHGIRPLILLNSHSGAPAPFQSFTARLLQPARTGDRTLVVDAATAARVVPGRSGLGLFRRMAGILFTGVEGSVVQLGLPLEQDLNAGDHPANVLRYAPFAAPRRVDGSPDPGFEETLHGWIAYVEGATGFVRRTLGDTRFDVEVWNELSFGSDFLDLARYRELAPAERPADTIAVLLARTVAALRDPARGLDGVAITDGFASQRPWDAASSTPAGLTALSKHPYRGATSFPEQARYDHVMAVDAHGELDADVQLLSPGRQLARDRFVPRYRSFFPEFFLSAIATETMIRDLSPTTTEIYGTPHGRHAAPPGRAPLEVWLTEIGMNPTGLDPSRPSPAGAGHTRLSARAIAVLQAKAALRAYVAYTAKGARAVYLYAADGPIFGLLRNRVAVAALTRMTRALAPARPVTQRRPLRLEQVADDGRGIQFRGDGSAARPTLHDRDVLAFFPFQLDARRWIAPVYVMTRDLARRHRPAPFRLRIAGLDGNRVRVRLLDPLTGRDAPAAVVERAGDAVTVVLQATDSPRLLQLTER